MSSQRDRILGKLSALQANAVRPHLTPITLTFLDGTTEQVHVRKCNRHEINIAAAAAGEASGIGGTDGAMGSGISYLMLVNLARFAVCSEVGNNLLTEMREAPAFFNILTDDSGAELLELIAATTALAVDTSAPEGDDDPLLYSEAMAAS